jgi:hypothetical protein
MFYQLCHILVVFDSMGSVASKAARFLRAERFSIVGRERGLHLFRPFLSFKVRSKPFIPCGAKGLMRENARVSF